MGSALGLGTLLLLLGAGCGESEAPPASSGGSAGMTSFNSPPAMSTGQTGAGMTSNMPTTTPPAGTGTSPITSGTGGSTVPGTMGPMVTGGGTAGGMAPLPGGGTTSPAPGGTPGGGAPDASVGAGMMDDMTAAGSDSPGAPGAAGMMMPGAGDPSAPGGGMGEDDGMMTASPGGAPTGATTSDTSCCSGGDCLCHGPDPGGLTSAMGPYRTATLRIGAGTVHYPEGAEPPFAAVALCAGFLNSGPEMASWGPFYASHGIVTVITSTLGSDLPQIRATKLNNAIKELQMENTKSGSPLFEKLSGRYGTSGYSMGGGGTTMAAAAQPSNKSSIGLAPWGGEGRGVSVPTLLLCGDVDIVAPCDMSTYVYNGIPDSTPKMQVTISLADHFSWFGPQDAGRGLSGKYALAFEKVFLEGDERWKPHLLSGGGGVVKTNIK